MQSICIVLTLVYLAGYVAAYPTGAPPEACETMFPGHGYPAQNTSSPYLVSVSPSTFGPSETVLVEISSFFVNDYYEGFMVQARNSDNSPVGKFEENPDYLVMDCPVESGSQNTATHNRHEHFTKTQILWTAPAAVTDVNFTFTIVRGESTFWVGIILPATMVEA